jgi:hypothetical protein
MLGSRSQVFGNDGYPLNGNARGVSLAWLGWRLNTEHTPAFGPLSNVVSISIYALPSTVWYQTSPMNISPVFPLHAMNPRAGGLLIALAAVEFPL